MSTAVDIPFRVPRLFLGPSEQATPQIEGKARKSAEYRLLRRYQIHAGLFFALLVFSQLRRCDVPQAYFN